MTKSLTCPDVFPFEKYAFNTGLMQCRSKVQVLSFNAYSIYLINYVTVYKYYLSNFDGEYRRTNSVSLNIYNQIIKQNGIYKKHGIQAIWQCSGVCTYYNFRRSMVPNSP